MECHANLKQGYAWGGICKQRELIVISWSTICMLLTLFRIMTQKLPGTEIYVEKT